MPKPECDLPSAQTMLDAHTTAALIEEVGRRLERSMSCVAHNLIVLKHPGIVGSETEIAELEAELEQLIQQRKFIP